MTRKELVLQQYNQHQRNALEELHSRGYHFIGPIELWTMLIDEFEVAVDIDILYLGISAADMVRVVVEALKHKGAFVGRVAFQLNIAEVDGRSVDYSDLIKAIIKAENVQWTIHQNDADPFPSVPHAHDYEAGLVLNLQTGELFRKRQPAGKVRPKELARLRQLIKHKLPHLTWQAQ